MGAAVRGRGTKRRLTPDRTGGAKDAPWSGRGAPARSAPVVATPRTAPKGWGLFRHPSPAAPGSPLLREHPPVADKSLPAARPAPAWHRLHMGRPCAGGGHKGQTGWGRLLGGLAWGPRQMGKRQGLCPTGRPEGWAGADLAVGIRIRACSCQPLFLPTPPDLFDPLRPSPRELPVAEVSPTRVSWAIPRGCEQCCANLRGTAGCWCSRSWPA
jgi:hypothetical protein